MEIKSMPFVDYCKAEGINVSSLLNVFHSLLHYKYFLDNPREDSESLARGRRVHTRVLEPQLFEQTYYLAPWEVKKNTAKGMADWAKFVKAAKGREIIRFDDHKDVDGIANSVFANKEAMSLINRSEIEQSLFWEDSEYKLKLKARVDGYSKDGFVFDLKTTSNASPRGFGEEIKRYNYHCKAAWYLDAVKNCGIDIDTFVFIAVESSPPYAVGVYTLDADSKRLGHLINREALKKVHCGVMLDKWPGYESLVDVGLSYWAKKELQEKYGEAGTNK